jgi:2-C-methyl-D-erythritol 2,4-cyclodiphosphate synthase
MNPRIGLGVDAHRRVDGRRLFLGGIEIPSTFGLLAHSDGDVICHAILDALLGAANLGDKGTIFPDTDIQYKDIRSTELLASAVKLLSQHYFDIVNIDVSVMCEEPKLMPHVPQMKAILSKVLCITPDQISVKATTLEKMGFTGRNEGIAAMAIAMLNMTGATFGR